MFIVIGGKYQKTRAIKTLYLMPDKKNLSLVRLAERLREIVYDYLSPVNKCAVPLRGRISSTARLNFIIKVPLEPRARGRQNRPIGERFR